MRNLTKVFFSYLTILFTASIASASSVGATGTAPMNLFALESEAHFSLQDHGTNGMTIEIDLPEAAQILAMQGNFGSLLESMTNDAGQNASVPFISKWVVIPDGFKAVGYITQNSGRRISIEQSYNYPVYLDQIAAEAVMLSDDNDDYISPVTLGNIVTYRGIRMAPVIVKPFQLSVEAGQIFESISLTFEIEFSPDNTQQRFNTKAAIRGEFARTMDHFILNPPARDLAPSDRGKMVIMHSHLLHDDADALGEIEEFANWKRQLGFDVDVREINIDGDNPRIDIKAELRDLYDEGMLDYLIIIGHYDNLDREGMGLDDNYIFPTYPTGGAEDLIFPGDQNFVTFDGDDDLLPDVIVGRFMCRTLESLTYALQRSINYEKEPEAGDWLSRVVYSLDSTDDPLKVLQPALDVRIWTDRRLREMGYDVIDTVSWHDRFVNAAELRDAISAGTSLALGDGWLWGMTSWTEEDGFQTSEVDKMSTFTISNAVHYTIPIMVPFFNQNPNEEPSEDDNGNVGGFGFWDPDDINHNITYILGWSVYGMRYHDLFEGGSLFQFAGIQFQAILDLQEDLRLEDEAIFLAKQSQMSEYQYLGDPTIQIRTGPSAELTVSHPEEYNVGATAISFNVSKGEDQPLVGGVVCIMQDDNFKYVAQTDGNGDVSFTVPEGLAEGEMIITANGHNVNAYNLAVAVITPAINIVLDSAELDDSDEELGGDNDGLFRNGETVVLDLILGNTGDDDADELTATFSSHSEYLTFSAEQVGVEDITSGETGGFAEQIEMTLAHNCPGSTEIQVMILVSSGELEWLVGFEIITSGPAFKIVEFDPLIFRNDNSRIRPHIMNIGDLDSPAYVATLSTENPNILIQDEGINYAVIEVGDTVPAEDPFYFEIGDLFIPGQMIDFELTLTEDGGNERKINFTVGPAGEASENDPVGPDSYGYMAFDSGDTDSIWTQTPAYQWREVNRDAAGDINFIGDRQIITEFSEFRGFDDHGDSIIYNLDTWDESLVLPLPFRFQYYGVAYDSFVVNTNGWMALGSDAIKSRSPIPWEIVGIGAPDALLCPYYLDLDNADDVFNGIFTYYIEDEDIFVVEWSGIEVRDEFEPHFLEFQILLHNAEIYNTESGDGEIVFQYRTSRLIEGPEEFHTFPTIGIRSPDGTDGIQYSFNEGYSPGANEIRDELAIKFTTDLSKPIGSVSGTVVRADNADSTLAGAVIDPHWLLTQETDDQGAFIFADITPGIYPFTVKLHGYNTIWDTLEVIAGEITILDTIGMTFPVPTISEETQAIFKSLRPDSSFMTRADFDLINEGAGELEYEVDIRYADGSVSNNSVFEKFDIITLTQGARINDSRIRGFAPLYVPEDSLLYIPIDSRDDGAFITILDQRPGDHEIVNIRMPIGEGDRSGAMRNLAWDGEKLWGAYYTQPGDNILISFSPDGEGIPGDSLLLPARNPYPNGIGLVYSPDRNSLFVVNNGDHESIFEISLRDSNRMEIVDEYSIWFQGRSTEIASMFWYPKDVDNMPLYMLDGDWSNDDPVVRILKLNPENGDWKIVTEFRDGLGDGDDDIKNIIGCAILQNYNSEHLAIAWTELNGGPRSPRDTLVIRDLGPNISFFSPGSFINKSGTIAPGGEISIGFEINAGGWEEGVYSWSYFVNHNGFGDGLVIPCILILNAESNIGDSNELIPAEFGLHAVYPNPFNGMTRINFGIAESAMTELRVYDISGREVDVLFSGKPSAGNHSIAWDASRLSSGVYLLRLESEGMTNARKVVLMK